MLACEAVPKSKKLLKFTLDDGTGTERTILSGIHAYYEPEDLVGKTCIAIVNLPPRPMMGIESCGMLKMTQASRLLNMDFDLIAKDDIVTICAEDIELPPASVKKSQNPIGFCVA